jgi:hypothetical protein
MFGICTKEANPHHAAQHMQPAHKEGKVAMVEEVEGQSLTTRFGNIERHENRQHDASDNRIAQTGKYCGHGFFPSVATVVWVARDHAGLEFICLLAKNCRRVALRMKKPLCVN